MQGGILNLYLTHGGPGIDPATGKRLFGFPKTDEYKGPNQTPLNTFEWAAIYWTQGTGGVRLTGAAYVALGTAGTLGLPLTSNIAIAGGEAIFCERGVAWASNTDPKVQVIGHFTPPLLGTPLILDPTPTSGLRTENTQAVSFVGGASAGGAFPTVPPFVPDAVQFHNMPRAVYDAVLKLQPNFFQTLYADRLSLVDTATHKIRVPLNCVITSSTANASTAALLH